MSIKDTFKKRSNKILQNSSLDSVGSEIESVDYEKAILDDKKRFVPDVDFSEISNFVKFGSAEKYYYDAITSIYGSYPYDGSLYEKLNWHNNSSDVTNYIFENVYPRTNGYVDVGYTYGTISTGSLGYAVTTNPEYIFIKGGPNASSENTLKKKFDKANKIDIINNRDYNLYINGETGLTTEFWLKKDNFSGSSKQVVFDLWNSASLGSNSYGRFTVDLRDSWDISSNISSVSTTLVGEGLPRAIYVKDGYNYYIIGSGTVRQYSSSVEWNTTTLGLVNTSSISSEFTNLQAQGLSFKPDGTKLFIIGTGSAGKVVEYSLSTPWNVATKTLNNTASVLQDVFMNDMYITPDGTSLFGLGDNNNRVYKYNFGTPWDITTLSYSSITASLPVSTWNGIYFKDDGTRMYAATTTSIFEYNLSIPWDITTAALVNNTSIAGTTCGISINNEGKNLFIVRFSGTPPNYIGTLTSYTLSSANKINLTISSGSINITSSLGSNLNITGSNWNHYSINAFNSGSSFKAQLYVNGELNDQQTFASKNINEVTGAYIATIGSLVSKHTSSATTALGYGKLSASLDEFRFWKSKRSDKDIKRYWFGQVGGGTNTDDANTNLGVYYKFNEGIINSSSISDTDKKIIDYSGRVSNGNWIGYSLGSRNTGSAMVLAGAADTEFKDPILYSYHPDVASVIEEKTREGRDYDLNNNASLINSFPKWMSDEDPTGLGNLTQLISEYFDDLYLKIKFLPEIHNASYSSGKPITFASKLLESHGFTTTDLFIDATVLESLSSRNENQNFEEKLHNVKNFIYQNIFNNLTYIYRSKGTEKSIRNFIRCFGIDENLIKVNLYANNTTQTIKDRYVPVAVKKKYVDFNDSDRFSATVYQHRDASDVNTLSYLPGSINTGYSGITIQSEIFAPLKFEESSPQYFSTSFVTSSIFGVHSANAANQDDYTWQPTDADLQVFIIKEDINSKNAKFKLTSSYMGINIESSMLPDIYTDSRWNLSLRFYHEKHPYANLSLGSTTGNYIVELIGKNIISDATVQEFSISQSIPQILAEQYFSSNKRLYVGSQRQNFTGSVLHQSDVRISSVRYWLSKLSDETLSLHAKDPLNYGFYSPYEQAITPDFDSIFTPAIKTLALHWDFENVTGSDNGAGTIPTNVYDGKFIVQDLTSGSINDSSHGQFGNLTKYQFIGRGDFFLRNQTNVIKREFVSSLKRRLPEVLNDTDMINIVERDDDVFTRDSEPIVHYFSLEKSMYQVVSDEMIKLFGSVASLNNIIGEPINRYAQSYKNLDRLRDLFFESVQNDIDLEKYIEFYKWFDQSIGDMIEQLIPFSSNFSTSLKTVIESHVLERNKYWSKYPTIELKKEPPLGVIQAINSLKYNWRLGSAPLSRLENEHCLWWLQRAERTENLNPERQKILDSTIQSLNRKFSSVYDFAVVDLEIKNSNPLLDIRTRIPNPQRTRPLINFSFDSYLEVDLSEFYRIKDCIDDE